MRIWKKCIYDVYMDNVRTWLKNNHDEALTEYNRLLFKDEWDKYIRKVNLSAWEMDALCFYYHEHELAHLNNKIYGIENFFDHSPEPEVEKFFKRGKNEIPIYNLFRIAGTVISKNNSIEQISRKIIFINDNINLLR